MDNIFEKASRLKLRFTTTKGSCTVEELWDLPLQSTTGRINLDDLARGYHKKLKNTDDNISFVDGSRASDNITQLQFDIVLHVITTKKAENKAQAESHERAEKKQKIMALIRDKDDQSMASKSREELLKELEAL